MKTLFIRAPRFRVALSLFLLLALMPIASLWNVSQAAPPRHAPAYGYRRKEARKRVYRRYERPQHRRVPPRRMDWRRKDRRPTHHYRR